MSDTIKCEVCDEEVILDGSYTAICSKCGAHYSYNEGILYDPGQVVKVDLEKGEVTFKIAKKGTDHASGIAEED